MILQIMDEKQINRNNLLDAISDFEKNNKYAKSLLTNNSPWVNFTNDAFNYRPYQTCIVM